jgi:hypothetical protein
MFASLRNFQIEARLWERAKFAVLNCRNTVGRPQLTSIPKATKLDCLATKA